MPPDRNPIWPSPLSIKDPLNQPTIRARMAEYQAVMQLSVRIASSPSYLRLRPAERRVMLRAKVQELIDKRQRQGRLMCSINIDEMIERHMGREAEMKKLKKAGIVTGRFPSNIVRLSADGKSSDEHSPRKEFQASVEDADEDEEDDPRPAPVNAATAQGRDVPQDQALRIQRLENLVRNLQSAPRPAYVDHYHRPHQRHLQPNLTLPNNRPPPNIYRNPSNLPDMHARPPNRASMHDERNMHDELTTLRAENQYIYTQLHERITALEDHALKTSENFARLSGLHGVVSWIVKTIRGGDRDENDGMRMRDESVRMRGESVRMEMGEGGGQGGSGV